MDSILTLHNVIIHIIRISNLYSRISLMLTCKALRVFKSLINNEDNNMYNYEEVKKLMDAGYIFRNVYYCCDDIDDILMYSQHTENEIQLVIGENLERKIPEGVNSYFWIT